MRSRGEEASTFGKKTCEIIRRVQELEQDTDAMEDPSRLTTADVDQPLHHIATLFSILPC
jgi:hypothetical protein